MDNHKAGPVETGAPMDYREHDKTYNAFLTAAKWGTMMVVVLLLAMLGGFFAGGGLLGGILLFVILNAAGFYLLR